MEGVLDAIQKCNQLLDSKLLETEASHHLLQQERATLSSDRDEQKSQFLKVIQELSRENELAAAQPSSSLELKESQKRLQLEAAQLRDQVDSLLEDDDLAQRRSQEADRQLDERQKSLQSAFADAKRSCELHEQRRRLLVAITNIRWRCDETHPCRGGKRI